MKYLALFCVLLVGCERPKFEEAAWQQAASTHACTPDQHARVEREAKWCSDNTSYRSTYCYGAAIMRNCTERQKS